MYYCVNILLTKNASPRRVRSESATYSRSADSISFSYIPVASQCISLLKPIDAPRLWGWTEEWAGLDSGLLRDDWRVCRKTASPFDWQRYYKKSLTLFELSPIADFTSVVEIQTAATYFLVFAWRNC